LNDDLEILVSIPPTQPYEGRNFFRYNLGFVRGNLQTWHIKHPDTFLTLMPVGRSDLYWSIHFDSPTEINLQDFWYLMGYQNPSFRQTDFHYDLTSQEQEWFFQGFSDNLYEAKLR
jgi:hypothetical protein